jgi:acetyl esterase
MPLDPTVAGLLAQMNDPNAPKLSEMTPEVARAGFAALTALQGEPEAIASVEDRRIPGPAGEIPVRIYRPNADNNLPVLVYFHGGGWVIMDIDTHDPLCRALANAAGCAVVSVDYRLAPEHKYPAASDDCYAATAWVAEHAKELGFDAGRIAIGGDSAGGHLTAVVAQMARDRGGPAIVFQVMHCPVTNYDYSTPSYRDNGDGYMLTKESMVWFWDHYLPSPSRGDEVYASPLRGELRGLPPALVQTGEFDPLRDEGAAYAKKLEAAGVDVTYRQYDGLIHDTFLFFGVVPGGRQNIDEAAEHLRKAFARK